MNKTKKLLIDITFESLYKKGYCATSISDVLEVAKLTKGALYYHFKTKDEMVIASIEHYIEMILHAHWIEPLLEEDSSIETIIKQINALYDGYADENSLISVEHGCPLNNFIMDMSDKNEAFFIYLKSVYKRWEESIEKVLTKAQILKLTHGKVDSRDEALFIISSIEGSIGSAKAYNDLNALRRSFNSIIKYIRTL